MTKRRGGSLAAALAAIALACSTAAEPPPSQECFDDEDCEGDLVCLLDQGGICQNLGVPARRPVLGVDITEGEFSLELLGCDAEIDPIDGELRTDPRGIMSTVISLDAHAERPTVGCADCTAGSTCEPGGELCTSNFEGTFSLRRSSRLGLASIRRDGLNYPLVDEMDMPIEGSVEVDWAQYQPGNEMADIPTVLELNPAATSLARMRFEMTPAPNSEARAFEPVSRLDCHRQITGRVRRVGSGSGMEGATVIMRFDEPVASQSTVLGASPNELLPCQDDDDCGPGRACNPQSDRCGLDLRGVEAARNALSDAVGEFASPIYTYCEDGDVDQRKLQVEVLPPEDSGLPRVSYSVDQSFALPLLGTPIAPDPLEADLCLPNWAPPTTLELPYSGEPVKLLSTSEGDYVCCSNECLPTLQEAREPSTASSCDAISFDLVAATELQVEDPQLWIDDGCMTPTPGAEGRFELGATCEAGSCPLSLSPGNTPEGQSYALRINSPEGSVFRSELRAINVTPETTELPAIELRPRVVLSGRVLCDQALGEDCVPEDVAVQAERIRMPGEPAGTPPPYFFETATVADGSYILLLDPGVYVMTALPPASAQAGPASFTVVDLRLGTSTSLVNVVDGVPGANAPVLQIQPGVPVVLRLRDFASGGRVRPYDRGSWVAQGGVTDPDGRALDFNDPTTCYAEAGAGTGRGCAIRSLLPRRAGALVTSISNRADFTMRFQGAIDCPAPPEDPAP